MPSFKYLIELSEQDRAELLDIVKRGNSPARTILRTNILLASDKGSNKHMTVSEIANTYHTTPHQQQFRLCGLRTAKKVLRLQSTGKNEKRLRFLQKLLAKWKRTLIALACGQPPEGYSKWTLRLLADRTLELGYIESISHVTISTILKKRI